MTAQKPCAGKERSWNLPRTICSIEATPERPEKNQNYFGRQEIMQKWINTKANSGHKNQPEKYIRTYDINLF